MAEGLHLDAALSNDAPGLGFGADIVMDDEPQLLSYTPPQSPSPDHLPAVRASRGQLPLRYRQPIPEGPAPIPLPEEESPENSGEEPVAHPSPTSSIEKITRTKPNSFGLIREYKGVLPVVDPDDEIALVDLIAAGAPRADGDDSQLPRLTQPEERPSHEVQSEEKSEFYAPFPNYSAYRLSKHYLQRPQKSAADFAELCDLITDDSFDVNDLKGVNFTKIHRDLASSDSLHFDNASGWRKGTVSIDVPLGGNHGPAKFNVNGLLYKNLTSLIADRFVSDRSKRYHYVPYRLLFKPSGGGPEEEVFREVYETSAFRDAHEALQKSPPEDGCQLPRAIAGLMFWSDSTHLTDFGDASLWPIYWQPANTSKYDRAKPSQREFDHVAYIPSVRSATFTSYRLLNRHALSARCDSAPVCAGENRPTTITTADHSLQTRALSCHLEAYPGRRI